MSEQLSFDLLISVVVLGGAGVFFFDALLKHLEVIRHIVLLKRRIALLKRKNDRQSQINRDVWELIAKAKNQNECNYKGGEA